MSKGLLFWVLMVVWFCFGLYVNREPIRGGNYGALGGGLLLFILLFILGWHCFGFVVQ
jgi:hypothetical protein